MGMGRARSHRVGNLAAEVSAVAHGRLLHSLTRLHSLDLRGCTEVYTWLVVLRSHIGGAG